MTSSADQPPLTGGALTRSRILAAAARLMNTVGLTRTTTKEIAREAGCSEAALYKHFSHKEEIFVAVLDERAPRLSQALAVLPERVGDGAVIDHLREVAQAALLFYRQTFPMAGSLFASPELLAAHRRALTSGAGPHQVTSALADYLRSERSLGRIDRGTDPDALALLLVGACFHRAFLQVFFGDETPEGALRPLSDAEFTHETVRAFLAGAAPKPPGAEDGH